jgi:hypothetical protein
LKERRPVVKITEEIGVRVGAHECAADDAARRGDRSKGGDAIDGNRYPTEHLAIDDDGQSANDAAGNLGKGGVLIDGWTSLAGNMKADKALTDRVITLCAGKEIYGGIKVVLGYEAVM